MTLWISPSQLAYMYRECPLCIWNHHHGAKRPGGDFSEFNLMDRQQKLALPVGTPLHGVGIPGTIALASAKVCSVDYGNEDIEARIFGDFDFVVALDAGGLAIVDLKSGRYDVEKQLRYQDQLSAYALSMIEPDRHQPMDIRGAYLLFCSPATTTFVEPSTLVMQLTMQGAAVDIDINATRASVRRIVEIVSADKMPKPSEGCKHCAYRSEVARLAKWARGVAA